MSHTLPVAEIQRFCMHDGYGVRTVVFLKGCPLRCAWCHNPEMQNPQQEILFYPEKCIFCGACVSACPVSAHSIHPERIFDREKCISCGGCADVCCTTALQVVKKDMTMDDVIEAILRDKAFYGERGGVTISGGEPMLHPNVTTALLIHAKHEGIHTALETCGYFPTSYIPYLIPVTDLFLYDIKDTNPERHKTYTGVDNALILKNLYEIDQMGGRTRLRCILVDGVNTDISHYQELTRIYQKLTHCEGIELIPYHAYAGSKMLPLGREDNGHTAWIPTEQTMDEARRVIAEMGAVVI